MGGLVYYARQPLLSGWKRIVSGICLASVAFGIGTYLQRSVELRYSTFRGRTALYGDTTVRYGWLDGQQPEKVDN